MKEKTFQQEAAEEAEKSGFENEALCFLCVLR